MLLSILAMASKVNTQNLIHDNTFFRKQVRIYLDHARNEQSFQIGECNTFVDNSQKY
jgi:hypothetical protein